MRGTVKSYDPETRRGLIAVKGRREHVPVDFFGSYWLVLSVGMKVEFQLIHRPDGVFASGVRVIPQVLE